MSRPIKQRGAPAPDLPPREGRGAHGLTVHEHDAHADPAEAERIHLPDDIAAAGQQLEDGEGVEHEAAKAKIRRRLPHLAKDPIVGLGSAPVSCGTTDGAAEHDRYLYESAG